MENTNIKFWERYAKLYKFVIEKSNKRLYEILSLHAQRYLKKEDIVLELACGSGQLTEPLSSKVEKWIATDLSKNMVNETEKRINNENVFFSVCDATKINYKDNSFDIVIISNALHIMPNPKKALNEIRRVLKKDGILIAPTFVFEGKVNKKMLWIAEKLGHHVFYKWNMKEYINLIENSNFIIQENLIVQGNLQPSLLVVAKK